MDVRTEMRKTFTIGLYKFVTIRPLRLKMAQKLFLKLGTIMSENVFFAMV